MIRSIGRLVKRPIRLALSEFRLPSAARLERRRDLRGLPKTDPGIDLVLVEAVKWLRRAQDLSITRDGGVAAHYSLVTGWGPSYPETTGYIVPTLIRWAELNNDESAMDRARRMLDWLLSIQTPGGGFPEGMVGADPVPVTFDTGQVLLGLAAGVRVFGDRYRDPMCRAADWLVSIQDADGAWRRHLSRLVSPGEKTYEMHTAWGLLEAARAANEPRWASSALRNVDWALGFQMENGWLDACCLDDYQQPLTHTLGYAFRGLVEAWRYSGANYYLVAAQRLADGLVLSLGPDGFLSGRLRPDWSPAVPWACLTGTAQIACCLFMLYDATADNSYLDAAKRATRYIRRTVAVVGNDGQRGGVKGSFPIDGEYGKWKYLNWACKFLVDALLLERTLPVSDGINT